MIKKTWVFPFEHIKKGSKIVIFGAGDIGTHFYNQIKITEYCEILAWVDSKYELLNNENVVSPEIIRDLSVDYIIVAIFSVEAVIQVMEYLESIGVSKSKIYTVSDILEKTEKKRLIKEHEYNKCFPNKIVDKKHLRIAFIVPDPIKGGGGHRNIFRAVNYLNQRGHEVCVYYTNSKVDEQQTKKNVCEWFYDLPNVEFIKYEEKMDYYDVGIATWWETANILDKYRDRFRKQMYFVQDFEPYFYPLSAEYFLAENTYKKGFLHICSGPWCETILKNKFEARAKSFQFPIDRQIYNTNRGRKKEQKNIIFFAKPEMSRRCFKIGIDALERFHSKRPDVEIILFGSSKLGERIIPFKATILNLLPTLNDLAELYSNADVGIVFSPTNPSLVPYEMMSCGCPVIDLNVEYAIEKYGGEEDNIILVDSDPVKFSDKLIKIIDDDELLNSIRKHAKEWVDKEFPDEEGMGKRVEEIILEEI